MSDINIKYPGLEDRVRAKVMAIFNGAKNIADLIKNALDEIVFVGGDAAKAIKKILGDLVSNIKTIVKSISTPSSSDDDDHFMVRRDLGLDQLKQKIKKCKLNSFIIFPSNICVFCVAECIK